MGNYLPSPVVSKLEYMYTYWATPHRIIIVGLDGAGKTTLLNKLMLSDEPATGTEPTFGFNVKTFKYKNIAFTAWDMGGKPTFRSLWVRYVYDNTRAVILVIDATDRSRIDEAAAELMSFFKFEGLRDAKLLVFANKQDLPGCMSVDEIREKLNLDSVTQNMHHIQSMAVIYGEAVDEGFDWLSKALASAT